MLASVFNLLYLYALSTMIIFDAKENTPNLNWQIVDDVVMGGRSDGRFEIDEEGHILYSGHVSLENNGGFSSLRGRMEPVSTSGYSLAVLSVKGDGKSYQFRIKSSLYDRHSYIAHFQTDGSWQTIEIPLADMYPAFRGRKLAIPNYPQKDMAEIAFLISNKKEETFSLLIDQIMLK